MAVAAMVTYVTDAALEIMIRGFMPNSCFAHRFGDGKSRDSMFDPTSYADVKLKCTNGAAGGAGAVVVQQLRR